MSYNTITCCLRTVLFNNVPRDPPIHYYAFHAIQKVHFIITLVSSQRSFRLAPRMSVITWLCCIIKMCSVPWNCWFGRVARNALPSKKYLDVFVCFTSRIAWQIIAVLKLWISLCLSWNMADILVVCVQGDGEAVLLKAKLSHLWYFRMYALLRTGAMLESEKPVWYDVYAAFPPSVEPKYDRYVSDRQPVKILYHEDAVRAYDFFFFFMC